MAIKAAVLKLVMLVCMDSQCSTENAYEVDRFHGTPADTMADCRPLRDARRAYYAANHITGIEFHCWSPDKLKSEGF